MGPKGLDYVHTYVPSSEIAYTPNFGMKLADYKELGHKKYGKSTVEFGFNAVAGHTTGLVIERTLATATNLDQLALREAIMTLSGKLKTLDGDFILDATGAQIGEITPLGQLRAEGDRVKFITVYPHALATVKPVYPSP